MYATTSACIKPKLVRRPLYHKVNSPSCVARRPLCHKVNLPSCVARQPLCHKVNLPRCEARRRHLIMTCDIFGTGQTNSLTLCYLFIRKNSPTEAPLSSHCNQHARPNYRKGYWREPHTRSIEGLDKVSAKFKFRCENFSNSKFDGNSFCQQVAGCMLLKITEKIIRRNVLKKEKESRVKH